MSTLAFSACFAVWIIFSIIGIPIKALLDLSETQFGLLLAMPILSGALLRLPLGMLADRYGGRNVFAILLLASIIPVFSRPKVKYINTRDTQLAPYNSINTLELTRVISISMPNSIGSRKPPIPPTRPTMPDAATRWSGYSSARPLNTEALPSPPTATQYK